MTSRFYRLPSLNALATFEASARHANLKGAAEELNVTPGAVSRQIKALEEEIGASLFRRTPSGLLPTPEGNALYSVLSNLFSRTAETIDAIRTDQRQQQVTLACTHALAKFWLMPRMTGFWRLHPDICLNHYISDDSREFRRNEVDLRIRYGSGAWVQEAGEFLFGDTLYPVASPRLLEQYPHDGAEDLVNPPLLHVDWVDPDWTGWDDLLRAANVSRPSLAGRRFSNLETALWACRDGQGLAIGWDRLVGGLIKSGELVRFTSFEMSAPGGYHLTRNVNAVPKPAVVAVRDWLLATARTEPGDVAIEF